MKKVLVLVAAATIFGSLAFAEKVMEVGVKGGLLLNAGTELKNFSNTKVTLGGDVGIFGHFGLVDLGPGTLSLQPEVFFSFGNGAKTEFKDEVNDENYKITFKYTSLDIALLIGYDIPVGKISIRPFLGPKVGIPIGKIKEEVAGYTYEIKTKGATVGMDFGCGIAVPLGKFVLGGDIRYGIDFNKVKAKSESGDRYNDALRRGALGINITAGYRF